MNILDSKLLKREEDFIVFNNEKTKVVFSTAEKNRNFNRNNEEGVTNLDKLKNEFDIDDVIYLKQTHSDYIYVYNGEKQDEFIDFEGDAIITKNRNVAIGVFTADCVPVILVDEVKQVVAAIHSGWKGTFKSITKKTINKMIELYNSEVENIKVYIGPHIRTCCYEVSEELKEQFIKMKNINENEIFQGRNLSMEKCIIDDLNSLCVKDSNINLINLCTYCSKDINLFSYRRSGGAYGRLFSFVIIK